MENGKAHRSLESEQLNKTVDTIEEADSNFNDSDIENQINFEKEPQPVERKKSIFGRIFDRAKLVNPKANSIAPNKQIEIPKRSKVAINSTVKKDKDPLTIQKS